MKKRLLFITANLMFLFAFSLPAFAVKAAPMAFHGGPIRHLRNGTSSNWSGYAAYNGTFNSISASWTQPAVDCATTPNGYSSYWVGLDGYNTSSVEQLGTEADCSNGTASYYAWYEMYPKPGYYINIPVSAGNNFTASVTYSSSRHGSGFTLSITNTSVKKNGSFSTTQRSNKALRASAEAIVEAPWSGGTLPLADFGKAYFTNTLANGSPIGNYTYDAITMDNPAGMKSTPSPLDSSKENFSLTWSAH